MALILTAGMLQAETWDKPVRNLNDNTITVSGNVAYPTATTSVFNWVSIWASGAVTVTGSGTVSAPDDWESGGILDIENASSVVLDSGVTFCNFDIETYGPCENITLKGTYQGCSIYVDSIVDLTDAKLQASSAGNCGLMLEENTTFIVSNLVISRDTASLMMTGEGMIQGNVTLNGTLPTYKGKTLTDPGCGINICWMGDRYPTLVITGSLTISNYTPIQFSSPPEGLVRPPASADVIVCGSVSESQLGYLKPYTTHEDEKDLGMQPYNGHFTAQAGGDGKVHIRLADGAGPEPGPTPPEPEPEDCIRVDEGQTVVLGESEETTPAADYPVYMNGGTAVATGIADSLLNNTIFTGNGGLVVTQDGQHTTLTGSDTVQYSLQGADAARGGDLAVGNAAAAKSTIQFKGASYKVGAFTVQNGLATIGTGTTLDANSNTVNAGGSITNFGTLSGNVELAAAGTSMLNQGTVNNDVTLREGSTLVNNGTIIGHTEIAGTAYGTGLFNTTQVLGGGALHIGNSPGYQHHNQLTLEDGGSLYFCVDGVRQATLTDNGDGTHSYLAADNLTLNGVQDIAVEVGINFIAAVLLDRTATLKLAEFGAVDGTTTLDDEAFNYNVTDTTGLLEMGELTTDGASLSFTGTVGDKALAALAGSHGTQVANTMWASTSLLKDFADMAEERLAGKMEKGATIAWAGGLGSFQRETEHGAGFTYNGGGYALGVQHAFMRDFAAGVAFGQSFGHFEARDKSLKARQRGVMPALTARYRGNDHKGEAIPVVTAHVAYGDMKYKADTYGLLPGHAEWTDRTLSAGITVGAEFKVGEETTVTPFVGLSYVAADQKDSVEDMGAINRRYHNGKMHNLSIPVGATLRSTMGALTSELTVAYRADVERNAPEVQCDCLGIKDTAEGADPGKHSLHVNAGGTYAVSDNVGIFASYTFNVRSHATSHGVNAGVQVSF